MKMRRLNSSPPSTTSVELKSSPGFARSPMSACMASRSVLGVLEMSDTDSACGGRRHDGISSAHALAHKQTDATATTNMLQLRTLTCSPFDSKLTAIVAVVSSLAQLATLRRHTLGTSHPELCEKTLAAGINGTPSIICSP